MVHNIIMEHWHCQLSQTDGGSSSGLAQVGCFGSARVLACTASRAPMMGMVAPAASRKNCTRDKFTDSILTVGFVRGQCIEGGAKGRARMGQPTVGQKEQGRQPQSRGCWPIAVGA